MTHAYFAKDTYDRLDEFTKHRIDIETLKTFGQGPDILFFYNIINLKCGKNVRIFGKYMQKHNTQDFFINLIKYIKEKRLESNKQVMSFLYGFIMHYALDMTIHPFVFYKTGRYNRRDKKTYKYNGLHSDMETYIDCYLIHNNEHIKPRKFKMYNYYCNVNKFSRPLNNTIDYVFKKTYGKDNMAKIYFDSLKEMKLFLKIFRYDPTGIKKKFYKFLDMIFPGYFIKKESLSYDMDHKTKKHYLNLEKNKWNHPKDENEIYDYSFIELYHIALSRAVNLINDTNEVLFKKRRMSDLEVIFPDLSYTSGKKCNIKLKTKYFEF
jgi:hypothetical protein